MSDEKNSTAQMDLIGEIVHRLKPPLYAIKSYVDLIEQIGGLTDQQKVFLKRIQVASETMVARADDIVNLLQVEENTELRKEPCNLYDIAVSEIHDLEGYASEFAVTLELKTADNLTPIQADGERIGQVLNNLLTNAIKYNRPQGLVTIFLERENEMVRVSVRDTGLGIPEKDRALIFERFYRASRDVIARTEGSGVGLYIARTIVQRHGGTIGVETELGVGSTFWFTLPVN